MGMLSKIRQEIGGFLAPAFNRHLVLALLLLGIALTLFPGTAQSAQEDSGKLAIHYFYSPSCSHCAAQKPFNEKLLLEYPNITIISHNVEDAGALRLLLSMAQNSTAAGGQIGTPTTFIGPIAIAGFESEEKSGPQIRTAIEKCLQEGCQSQAQQKRQPSDFLREFYIPLIGKADLSSFSLPLLAIVLGLVDGFNPCAMWVLVYLISLVLTLNDRSRIWLVVGTFVLASGILYFLFMTAWLNAFLFLGYVRPLTLIIGLAALGGGILSLKEYIETKGQLACKAADATGKKPLMRQMQNLVSAPLTLATLAGIIMLAFVVNSIEFACSSAIPAVFTQVLALSNLPTLEYYLYILLYDFFFMLDDMIIFGLAAFTVSSSVGESYAKYCKVIGGILLAALGLMLLFAPGLLA